MNGVASSSSEIAIKVAAPLGGVSGRQEHQGGRGWPAGRAPAVERAKGWMRRNGGEAVTVGALLVGLAVTARGAITRRG